MTLTMHASRFILASLLLFLGLRLLDIRSSFLRAALGAFLVSLAGALWLL